MCDSTSVGCHELNSPVFRGLIVFTCMHINSLSKTIFVSAISVFLVLYYFANCYT